MRLEFADGTQLTVKTVLGGQHHTMGAQRDVLAIEVDPSEATFDELKALFTETEKTKLLTDVGDRTRTEIGRDYTIFLSCADEMREVPHEPGVLEQPKTEEVIVVRIAQITYMEKLVRDLLEETKK